MSDDLTPYTRALAPERPRPPKPRAVVAGDYQRQEYSHLREQDEIARLRLKREHPLNARETPAMHKAYEAHLQHAQIGTPLPNSDEETDALMRIDAARAEALEEERKRGRRGGGRVTGGRIKGGRWVDFVSPGRGRGLIEVPR